MKADIPFLNKMASSISNVCWLFLLAVICGSCSISIPKNQEKVGASFLEDYTDLEPVNGDANQLFFIEEGVNWGQYNSLIIESPTLILTNQSPDTQVVLTEEQIDAFKTSLKRIITKRLSKNYRVVNQSGPKALRLRIVVKELKDLGSRAYGAQIESGLFDSVSAECLMIAVNLNFTTEVGTANETFPFWVDTLSR